MNDEELCGWFIKAAIGIIIVGFLSAFVPGIQWVALAVVLILGVVGYIRYEQKQKRLDDDALFGPLEENEDDKSWS